MAASHSRSPNLSDRCGNDKCPMRFICEMDLESMPEFPIEERCQMGWKRPKRKRG